MNTQRKAIVIAMATIVATVYGQKADAIIINSPNQVIVTQTADSIDIRVAGKQGNPNYRFEQRVRLDTGSETITTTTESRHSPLGWDFGSVEKNKNMATVTLSFAPRIDAGIIIPICKPNGMSSPFLKSVESGIRLLTLKLEAPRGNWWIGLDYSFKMQVYTLNGDRQFFSYRDGMVSLSPYPTENSDGKSRLMIMNCAIELNYYYRLWKRSALGLGAELLFGESPWSHCRSSFTDADGQTTQLLYDAKTKPCNLNFKLAWMSYDHFSFYIRYSPWSPFKGSNSPKFSTLSFGASFGF